MSKLQFYGIFVLSVLCGAALSESWRIGISIEDTAIVVNFSIGFFRLPLLSKTWIWSKIQIGITAGCQINCLNNNLLQWTNVLRCFVRDSYLKIYMCLQTNLKTQENKNARAIFKTRNCTFIVHQEGGAADKKCQAFAISPQFAFNSARYGGAWVLPENGWSWCRVRFQVRPIVVSLSLSVSIWISVSVSTLIFWLRIRFIRDYTLKSMRLKVKTFLQVSFVLDVDFCKRQKNGKRCVCLTKPKPFCPSSWTGSINCHQGWSS